jgi:NitT/TauT family transport system substrate-binding protein
MRLWILIAYFSTVMTAVAQEDAIVFTPQWTAQAQFAGYYVAEEKGFYRDAGVKVQIKHPSATQSAMSLLSYDVTALSGIGNS